MKWLLLAVLTLLGSVAVALVALPDPGYVLIGYGKYSLETSLLAFSVVLVLVYLGVRALASVWRVPVSMQRWGQQRRAVRLQRWFDAATLAFTEGRYERAERSLARLLKFHQVPVQAYLTAARAAGRLGADQRRDSYLKLARQRQPEAEAGILTTQVELQLASKQTDQAQTTLNSLQALGSRGPRTLQLWMQLYLQQQNWSALSALLPELRRAEILNKEQWQQLALQVYRERISDFASAAGLEALYTGWRQLPPPLQQDAGLLAVYIEQLVRLGDHEQAGQRVREQLQQGWDERLVYLFGEIQEQDAVKQQECAEQWLRSHDDSPALLLALAKISLRNRLWGKARHYLDAATALQPTPEGYRLLAALLEQLGEAEAAAECYQKGLLLLDARPLTAPPVAELAATP
jgi:HemY protein